MSNRAEIHSFLRMFVAAATITATAGAAVADSAEDFFKKVGQITLYVGSGAGGGYDQIARLVAPNLSRFLPGHPNIVVENMPTAGGIQASNFIYNTAPKDGSVILADVSSAIPLPVYNSPVAHYDPRKFEWIGSTTRNQALCVTWGSSGIKTLDDAKQRAVTVSATSVTSETGAYPSVLNDMFGTKFKVVAGYSTGGMLLAVERGEVDGLCGYSWQTFKASGSNWFVEKKVNILVQMGLEKIAEFPDVPKADDLLPDPEDKQVLDMVVSTDEYGRPYLAPPGTPADRMAVYRQAFKTMLKDPQFLAAAAQQRIVIDPLDDKEIMTLLDRAYTAPKNVHDRAAVFAAQMN